MAGPREGDPEAHNYHSAMAEFTRRQRPWRVDAAGQCRSSEAAALENRRPAASREEPGGARYWPSGQPEL
jgi:hypothetical protein